MTTGPDSTSRIEEQLSAWLDDELPARELDLLVNRLVRHQEQRARVARYALIGSHLRAGRTAILSTEFLALRLGERVKAAVEDPPDPARMAETRRPARWLPYAVAAGGALLVVTLVPLVRLANYPPADDRQTAVSAAMPTVTPVSLSSNRMTNYLVYHGEYSGMLSAKVTDSNIVNQHSSTIAMPLASDASAR